MKSYLVYFEHEFKIFEEILHGRLKPVNLITEGHDILSNLIEFANSKEILIPKDELEQFKKQITSNHTKLGYRCLNDMIIITGPADIIENVLIKIIPANSYLIGNTFKDDIEEPPDTNSMYYLKLMIDEFERIKIRACRLLHIDENTRQTKKTILNNLKQIEHQLREVTAISKIAHHDESSNPIDIYVLDTLKKFVVKTIRFYYTVHDPHLWRYKKESLKLIKECDQISFPGIVNYIINKEVVSQNRPLEVNDPETKYKCNKQTLQWNGKLNHLATIFFELQEKGFINRSKHERNKTNMDLVDFIHQHFLDNNGQSISKDTLKTYLNPNKPDKRSKKSYDY